MACFPYAWYILLLDQWLLEPHVAPHLATLLFFPKVPQVAESGDSQFQEEPGLILKRKGVERGINLSLSAMSPQFFNAFKNGDSTTTSLVSLCTCLFLAFCIVSRFSMMLL